MSDGSNITSWLFNGHGNEQDDEGHSPLTIYLDDFLLLNLYLKCTISHPFRGCISWMVIAQIVSTWKLERLYCHLMKLSISMIRKYLSVEVSGQCLNGKK